MSTVILVGSLAAEASDYKFEIPQPSIPLAIEMVGETNRPVLGPRVPLLPLTPPLLAAPIECTNFNDNFDYIGAFLFPPDPHCAVGPTHIINVTNTIIQWRPKVGAEDLPQYQNTLMGFFGPVPGVLPVFYGFDPKAMYDQYSGRFVVVFLQRQGTPPESRILVAVSKTSDPNLGWWHHVVNSTLHLGGDIHWADYPGLACDGRAVYITSDMFSFGSVYLGVRLWIIDKTPTYTGPDNGIAFTIHDPYTMAGAIATTTQPAHMFGVPPSGTGGRTVGTYLVSYSGISNAGIEGVQVVEVTDPLGEVGGPYFVQQVVSVGDIDTGVALVDATQLGETRRIETFDRRAFNAVWRNNSLYLCAEVMPTAAPDIGQATAHWWRLDTIVPPPGLTVADQGNVGGEDLGAATHTYYPSVMVDRADNLAIGFSASNPTIYAGAYYTARLASDAPGTVGATGTLALGVASYLRAAGNGSNRWGDYTGLALCPVDETTFYVYNEYAGPQGNFSSGNGRWHTKVGWFRVEGTVAVAISQFTAFAKDGAVSIVSEFRSDMRIEAVSLYRGLDEGDLRRIATVSGTRERFEFTDRSVVAGTEYWYQIGVADGDGEFVSPIVRVFVPGVEASLSQNEPNPFNPSTVIHFALSIRERAILAVYGADGRHVRTLVDETRDTGRHEARWDGRDENGALVGSGVYFCRLTAGKFMASIKMVLLK